MLLLKGDKGKSVVVNDLTNIYKSACFEYCDMLPVIQGSVWINSNDYSLIDFHNLIAKVIDENEHYYTYLIIYTNKTEEDLKDFIKWLNDNEAMFRYRCNNIIVACK